MSRIDDLILELCPRGVEFKELHTVCEIHKGEQLNRADLTDSAPYPVINGGIAPSGYHTEKNFKGPALTISQGGASAGYVSWIKSDFWAGAHCYVMEPDPKQYNMRFLYFVLTNIQDQINRLREGAGIPGLSLGKLKLLKIPVPPMQIQQEIISILDTFTEMNAELEAELEARRKQYHFYRESLFSSVDPTLFRPIGDVATCFSGATPSSGVAEYWQNGTIPWMSSGEVNKSTVHETDKKISLIGFESCSTKMVPSGSVVIALAGQGKTRGMVARTRIDLCTNQSLCAVIPGEDLLADYLFFYLKTQYSNLRNISAGEGGRGGLNLNLIKGYEIPVPSIEDQREVVDILELFDRLVESGSEGILAELDARRKQYGYFRDKLLTFKELAA